MSNLWFWSDVHFGDKTVAEKRGFEDVNEHDAVLCDAWASLVNKRDSVILLGDISKGSSEGTARALSLIASLPGVKHLVSGNHDAVHPMKMPGAADFERAFTAFSTVASCAQRKIDGTRVMLSHFPFVGGGDHIEGPERHTQWRLPDMGHPLVHGHVHGAWATKGRMFNVGVEHHPEPVHRDRIAEWIEGL